MQKKEREGEFKSKNAKCKKGRAELGSHLFNFESLLLNSLLRLTLSLLCLGFFIACGTTEPDTDEIDISGITQTFENGQIGQEDPDDWRVEFLSGPVEPWVVLSSARPNPVSLSSSDPCIKFTFSLLRPSYVKYDVINRQGEKILFLSDRELGEGRYTIKWRFTDDDGNLLTDDNGNPFAPGLYRVMIDIQATDDPSYHISSYGDVQIDP